jgi:uncharacterized protein (DUF2147 family)
MLLANIHSAPLSRGHEELRRGTRLALLTTIFSIGVTAAASAAPLDPSGLWSTKDDESIIRIGACSAPPGSPTSTVTPPPYCGTLVWLKEPLEKGVPKTDVENPDKEKRSRPLIGLELLTELSADADHWTGKAYNADDGKVYDITFKVMPDKVKGDKGEIRGCVLRILCQSETFTKVQAVPGGDPTLPAASHGMSTKAPPAAHH